MTDSTSISGNTSSHDNTAPHASMKNWPVQFILLKFDKEVSECLDIMKDKTAYQVISPKIEKKDRQFSVWKNVRVYHVKLTLIHYRN